MHKFFMLSTAIAGILFCSSSCQQQTTAPAAPQNNTQVQTVDFSGHLPIAYVEVDSLLSNYNLAKDLNEKMLTRQENARATINEKGRQLEKEVAEFERKVKNNAFLSQERFEQEQQRLLKKQQELQAYAQQLENELLQEQHIHCESIILCQDATMQRRMGAVLKKYVPDMQIIPYAAYRARVKQEDGKLHYIEEIPGMWDMKRYVSLLLGEIQRLTDDENGYGPKGADFIAHVDIPEGVQAAYRQLSGVYENLIRKADSQYASPRHQVLGNTFDK